MILLALVTLITAQAAAAPPVALVETFADGSTTFEIVTAKPSWRWTPQFPRIQGFKPREGDPEVKDLKITRVLDGENIRAGVSLLVGLQHDEKPVAEYLISPGVHVVVDALRAFGVEPITLSMTTVAPFTPYPPIVMSVSPQIEIAVVELRSAPYPGYRITLRNLSSKAVSNVRFQAYRGDQKALSGLPRGENGRPLLTPGGSYDLDINLTSGGADPSTPPSTWKPRGLDTIEIESIRWEDGSYDGASPYPASEAAIERDGGVRPQLTRVIAAYRDTLKMPGNSVELIRALKQRIAALPENNPQQLAGAQAAMRGVKAAVLGDIIRFENGAHPWGLADVREWLKLTLERYEAWFSRLAA